MTLHKLLPITHEAVHTMIELAKAILAGHTSISGQTMLENKIRTLKELDQVLTSQIDPQELRDGRHRYLAFVGNCHLPLPEAAHRLQAYQEELKLLGFDRMELRISGVFEGPVTGQDFIP